MIQEPSTNNKSQIIEGHDSDIIENDLEHKLSFWEAFKILLANNRDILSFLQVVFAIITVLITIFAIFWNNNKQDIVENNKDKVEINTLPEINDQGIENLKKGIAEKIELIDKDFQHESESIKSGERIKIRSFHNSILHLIAFQGVHEETEFTGIDLKETSKRAILNISLRNKYDDTLRGALINMNTVFDLPTIKNDKDFAVLKVVHEGILSEADEWLYCDSIRNNNVRKGLESIKSDNDSNKYNLAISELIDLKRNINNYSFQNNLYSHIYNINRLFK